MLSTTRAFVLQLDSETEWTTRRLKGRVEHISSGSTTNFESLETLLSFLQRLAGEGVGGEEPRW